MGEKTDLSCYCGATAGNRQKTRILVGESGENWIQATALGS
jgi:hypothetical protein